MIQTKFVFFLVISIFNIFKCLLQDVFSKFQSNQLFTESLAH